GRHDWCSRLGVDHAHGVRNFTTTEVEMKVFVTQAISGLAVLACFATISAAQPICPPEVASAKAMLSKMGTRTEQLAGRTQDVQSPRTQDTQSPRTQDVPSARTPDVQSPRTQDVQSPRNQDVQSPRSQDVQSPRYPDAQPRGEGI